MLTSKYFLNLLLFIKKKDLSHFNTSNKSEKFQNFYFFLELRVLTFPPQAQHTKTMQLLFGQDCSNFHCLIVTKGLVQK